MATACLGRPPHEPPCDVELPSEAAAKRHGDEPTRHASITGSEAVVARAVKACHHLCEETR